MSAEIMRIGINTLACMPGRSGGDGRYVRELVRHLVEMDSTNQYFLFVAPWNQHWFPPHGTNVHRVLCPVPRSFILRVIWEQTVLPLLAARLRLDVFHAPVNVAPLAVRCPVVLTMLEAEPFMFPSTIPLPLLLYWRLMRRASALKARRVITISESSKAEIVRFMRLDPTKLEVVSLGVDASWFECRSRPNVSELPPGIRPPYILWTGRSYPRKNLPRLIEAFSLLQAQDIPHMLVLVGVAGWADSSLHQVLGRSGNIQSRVQFTGHVTDEALVALYAHADAFLFPSMHEGFGLPVLEAMACGTPVVTSSTTATAEVAGDAAVLVNPRSPQAIAEGILEVIGDKTKADQFRKRGLQRVQQYSWRSVAAATQGMYRRAVVA